MSKREDILDTSRFGSENGIRKGLIIQKFWAGLIWGMHVVMIFVRL